MLDIIHEETDSEYYRSLEYCNTFFKRQLKPTVDDVRNTGNDRIGLNQVKKIGSDDSDYEAILFNCEGYLEKDKNLAIDKGSFDKEFKVDEANDKNLGRDFDVSDPNPKLYPKTISDKIFNFKKDFSNHDYVNVNFDNRKNLGLDKSKSGSDTSIDLDRRIKNELLRQQFFLSGTNKNDVNDKFNKYTDKNEINDKFNRLNDKKIECHSIRNDITKTGPDVKVSGALNMKLFNLDKYNRILTTTETFMETAEASFTKNELNLKKDDFESFIKRSEKYFTSEHRERETTVHLNNASTSNNTPKGKTEIRIVYNPTFLATQENIKGFCQFCSKRCRRTDLKCCPKCVCLELELKDVWKDNWLNILLILALIFVLLAIFIQWLLNRIGCYDDNDVGNGTCFDTQ